MDRLKFLLAAGLLVLLVGLIALLGFAAELGVEPATLWEWAWFLLPVIFAPKITPALIIFFLCRRLWLRFRRGSKSAD